MYPKANEAFQDEIKKLKANYGLQYFSQAKVNMIWEELKEFSPKQIKSICDKVLGAHEFAPTIQPFREYASMLRDRIREFQKEQERRDADDFWNGIFLDDDKRLIVKTIKDKMNGLMSEGSYTSFTEDLKRASEGKT